MKMLAYTMKCSRWLPFLAACILSGCASGPQPPSGAWPWEHAKDTGNYQTGNHFAVSGNVANFGEAPKAANPVKPETLEPRIPAPPASEAAATKTPPPSLSADKPDSGKTENKGKKDYDFTVSDIKIVPPPYLPSDAVSTTYDITAFNWGNAPVSVAIGIDVASSRNISTDKALPLTAVVAPNTNRAVVHVGPKMKNEAFNLSYRYSWSIGDYTARHRCPEHYRFPFGENVRGFASVSDKATATPYTRNAVVFSVPAGTPVLVARKGTVVRIAADDRIDILHDDATIGTYSHLGKIADGVIVGKAVSTDDVIGTAGAAGNGKHAYLQLTVWHPEPAAGASRNASSPGPGFDLVSFPLEFCRTGSDNCGVLTQGQAVSRNEVPGMKKQGKRKPKEKRKDGSA